MTARFMRIAAMSAWALVAAACLGFAGGTCRRARADEAKPVPQVAQRPNPQEQQRRQELQNWEQRLTTLLHSHLNLIRTLCGELPRDQRRAIAQAGERATKEAAARVTDEQLGMRKGRVAKQPPAGPAPGAQAAGASSGEDPEASITDALREAVADQVGVEQAAAFTAELAAREERWRRSVVASIVGILDTELWLTAEQREAVERSLLDRWNVNMILPLQGRQMVNGRRVLPGVPDECIRPHLTPMQQETFGPPNPFSGTVPTLQAAMFRLGQCIPALNRDPWWFE